MPIEETKIRSETAKILSRLNNFYLKLNQELLFGWRRVLSRQSDNRITLALRALIENPATALLLNTVLFYFIGCFFGGLIGRIMFVGAGLNIVIFCAELLNWKDKL